MDRYYLVNLHRVPKNHAITSSHDTTNKSLLTSLQQQFTHNKYTIITLLYELSLQSILNTFIYAHEP